MADYLDYLMGLGETGATLGSGAMAGLLGMPYGVYKGATSGKLGTREANRIAEEEARKFMEQYTYQPRGQVAPEMLQTLGGLLDASKLPPVIPEAAMLASIPRQAVAAQAERAGMAAERAVAPMVERTMKKGGVGAGLLSDLAQGTRSPLDVYHGTPHTLPPTPRNPLGEFDASKIGTGEGGQAFGYGIYTAEARQVGEEYARILANADKMNQGRLTAHANAQRLAELTGSPQYAADDIRFVLESNPDHEQKKLLNETLKFLESGDYKKPLENKGNLYKIDLPDEKIATMLDWDKPVSQQKNVMNALRNEAEQRVKNNLLPNIENDIRSKLPVQDIGDDYLSMFGGQNVAINQDIRKQALEKLNQLDLNPLVDKELASFKTPDMTWDMSGGEFYKLLATRNGSAQQASNILQQQGVAGIKYLDEVSRSRGQGTRNFVVFPNEEKSMTILERNGMTSLLD